MTNLTILRLKSYTVLSVVIISLIVGCKKIIIKQIQNKSPFKAQIFKRGHINAFEEGLTTKEGKIVYCETSAIVYDGNNLIFASDKPIPSSDEIERSPVYSLDYKNFSNTAICYFTTPVITRALKYEDFTITPGGSHIIATTGFDRIKTDSPKWDNYNTMLVWPVGKPEVAKVVSPSTVSGITSSKNLRDKISFALRTSRFPQGIPYFKIEGLAAIPGNQLLIGIRESGESYKKFEYEIKILSVSYAIKDNELILSDDFKLVYDFDASTKQKELGQVVALSSIEYDKYNDRLLLLTSYEDNTNGKVMDENIGAFLWHLSIDNLKTNKPPTLILKRSDSKPLLFAHKGEGVTVINKNRVVVVHDDDRVLGRKNIDDPETQFSRKPHQAAYTIVDFHEDNQQ